MIRTELLPTPADVEFFRENGYWTSKKVLDDEFLARLRKAQDDVYDGIYDTGREPWMGYWKPDGKPLAVRKTDQAHWASRTIAELVVNETIGAMAAILSGKPGIKLWHDQLLYKPGQGANAKAGGNVGWHQDRNYWQCTDDTLLTAWVAFGDVTPQNGCMQMVPGSNKWGLIKGDFFSQDLEEMKRRIEAESGRIFETVYVPLKAGEVSFHHCLTIHGSGPNSTDKPRRSLVLHLMPSDARYVAGSPDDNHMNAILMKQMGARGGELFEGDLWPTLFPRTAVEASV